MPLAFQTAGQPKPPPLLRLRRASAGGGAGAPLSISGTPPTTASVGTPYSFTPTASGGAAPYTFSLTGTLPPGLSFNTSTGAITGTPT